MLVCRSDQNSSSPRVLAIGLRELSLRGATASLRSNFRKSQDSNQRPRLRRLACFRATTGATRSRFVLLTADNHSRHVYAASDRSGLSGLPCSDDLYCASFDTASGCAGCSFGKSLCAVKPAAKTSLMKASGLSDNKSILFASRLDLASAYASSASRPLFTRWW